MTEINRGGRGVRDGRGVSIVILRSVSDEGLLLNVALEIE